MYESATFEHQILYESVTLEYQRILFSQYSHSTLTAFSQNSLINSVNPERNHNLRVMATPQWPVPYYQRAYAIPTTLFPEDDYNVRLNGRFHNAADEVNVRDAQDLLKQTMEGREVLETMHSMGLEGTMLTSIDSPKMTADVYIDDLLSHVGYTYKENERILKKHKISDIFS